MQTQRVRIWFVALYVFLVLNYCDSHQHQQQHKHIHNKARSKYMIEGADDKPEGKIFGWKKQPQTNVIIITRPASLPAAPVASSTITAFTTPVTSANVGVATVPTATTVRRPYVQRYGGYRRTPVRRQNAYQGQAYRRRASQRPWQRRRVWGYGREEENDMSMQVNGDADDEFTGNGQESLQANEGGNDRVVEEKEEEEESEMKVRKGVSAKLDIEQLGKSLLSQRDTYTHNDAGEIAVVGDDLNKVYKQKVHEHLKLKSKKPQTTAILASTMPATFMPATAIDATVTTSNEPTYADVVVNSNGNIKKNKNSGEKRQTIWQGIRQAWRARRDRQKNVAIQKQQQQQQQQQEQLLNDDENEHEVAYIDTENGIFIVENGELQIKKKRKNNHNNRKKQMSKQQQQQQQQLNLKNKQKKRRKQQEVTNETQNSENNVISANNTNSRLQNIMNAFRRTPIIYKQQGR